MWCENAKYPSDLIENTIFNVLKEALQLQQNRAWASHTFIFIAGD